jgi:hypothetical protein
MKLKVALATVGMMLLGAVAAYAQPLPLTIDFRGTELLPTGNTGFDAIISNDTSSPVDIAGISFTGFAPGQVVGDIFTGFPPTFTDGLIGPSGFFTLAPNTHLGLLQPFFEATGPIDPNMTFSVVLTGTAGQQLGSQGFTGAGANVPEPGTVALLLSTGLCGGGLLMARRRRK